MLHRFRAVGRLVATTAPWFALPLVWLVVVLVEGPAWLERTVGVTGLCVLTGLLVRERRGSQRREQAAVDAERRLSADRATIVQLVSHEFRTPLTMIRGGVETLLARSTVEPELRPVADAVQRATHRLDAMLAMVLAAADRFEVEEHERVGTHLETIVDDLVGQLPSSQAERVRVRVTAAAGVETCVTRRGIVGLLLQTVLDNALKFSPVHEPVEVEGVVTSDEVVLRVRDRGPGLAPDFAVRAFEMFTQLDASTSREQSGLGMGLFTARRLTTRLGGRIELSDGPDGRGCVAEIRLPRVLRYDEQLEEADAGPDWWDVARR